eukprot:CAMPEP_0119034030 /NCGR_PEP_ID=MMETSP1177-20130426/1092_1 /TAXON_ID=2985 /ORGANISM="Ochromonas sp, Strain CCMP1899" /LENGTH=217 /DNA_ID=CAMNT_0006991225 /DNA_START=169 /DNA_END=822 /DNA_ORIENTATION=+
MDPADLAKQWRRNLTKEARVIDRDVQNLGREEAKAMKECKKLAKEGRLSACKILAKEVINTRQAVARMQIAKAQMNSVSMILQTSVSMIKMQGCMQKSAEIMTSMNSLVKLPEIRATMQAMSTEMARAGMIEEMVGDTMESMEPEGLEGDADVEVQKIIDELTAGMLGSASSAPTAKVVTKVSAAQAAAAAEEGAQASKSEEEAAELKAMQERLQSL